MLFGDAVMLLSTEFVRSAQPLLLRAQACVIDTK